VTLQAIPPPAPLPGTNPTSGGLATRRTHTMVEGDTLASVAYKEYRDPSRWRALAVINGIDDPMRVAPGTELMIPEKREADALVG
jgi:nucleoid-associated protein YgaU